ncbi:MAG: hypothetical protein FOGNACKC_05770 [Anaerolineae bacterium]|nr:hypothetical protein [Anaerolineae bacterium]
MSNCCHGAKKKSKGNRWLTWLSIGGFALVVILLAIFDGNPLVSQVAPLVLLGLTAIWFVGLLARRMGIGR